MQPTYWKFHVVENAVFLNRFEQYQQSVIANLSINYCKKKL